MLRSRLVPLGRSLARFVRAATGRLVANALPWGAAAIGLELLGRYSRSDAIDAIGVLFLWGSAIFLAARHEAGLRRARTALARFLRPWRIEFGLDLRRTPPIARRLPARYVGVTLAATLLVAGLFLGRSFLPAAASEALRAVSGLLWLALLATLWAGLAAGILLSLALPAAVLVQQFGGRDTPPRRRRTLALASCSATIAGAALAFHLLPSSLLPTVFLVLGAVFALLSAAAIRGLGCLWRNPKSRGGPAAFSSAWIAAAAAIWCALPFAALTLLGAGDGLDGSPTAVTAFLTRACGWLAAIAYTALFGMNVWSLVRNRLDDPARGLRPRVHVKAGRAKRASARRALTAAGFDVRVGGERAATDVPLVVDPAAPDDAFRTSFVWPRRVAPGDLDDPRLHELCRRREEILARRALRRGLERILRHQMRRDFQRGSGYWIGPHLWLLPNLTRDTDEEDGPAHLGPRYSRVIPRRARHAFHRLLSDVEIDLIFLEDGVSVPRFRRVLGLLFEFHDLFGRRALEERHFQGLPGTRVLIQEHDFAGEPGLRARGYPEPDYEDLSRARILHVFVDRGGDAEPSIPVPTDSGARWSPTGPELVPSA